VTRRQLKHVILVPLGAWAALAAAILITCVYANLPQTPAKPAIALLIAAAQAVVSALVFMRLDRASALLRLTALAGLAWLSLLFILSFGDYLTRGVWPPPPQ
jgi:cytochrome c oxidase subunit 4